MFQLISFVENKPFLEMCLRQSQKEKQWRKLVTINHCSNFKDLLNLIILFAPGFGSMFDFVYIFSISGLKICIVNTRSFP